MISVDCELEWSNLAFATSIDVYTGRNQRRDLGITALVRSFRKWQIEIV